ncbi:MAG: sensor histidine kinase [Acidobacteria bacterium]|nr:sensor histidine kinase [Acidobacteriota bacterium]
MRFKTWPVAALGLAGLLVLIVLAMQTSAQKAQEIYNQIDQLNGYHNVVDAKLWRLRSDIHLSSIFIRDSLLDIASEHDAEYRTQLADFRRTSKATVAELRAIAGQHQERLESLEAQLDDYWRAFEPLFGWAPTEKILNSAGFLRREVVPRREKVMTLASEIEALNEANLAEERAEAARRHAEFQRELARLQWQTLSLGAVVALVAVFRLRLLEQRSDDQRLLATQAEQQMRELSQRLVAAQEEERKNLSRELHDHVAQVLTALRMEIGRIDRVRPASDLRISAAVAECRRLVDNMFRTVRDLSMGLRPSMLDDFGLQAALEWLVRDFTSRFGIKVDLELGGELDGLPERHRTCVYRAVQEALTNCARHSGARSARVQITGTAGALIVRVSDDGVGIDPVKRRNGLGLRGIEERVKELGGTMQIGGGVNLGTVLMVQLPLPVPLKDVSLASAAS